MRALQNWLADLPERTRARQRRRRAKCSNLSGLGGLLLRLYVCGLVWCGMRHAQRAGIDIVAVAVMRGCVTVWDREQPAGSGLEIRLSS